MVCSLLGEKIIKELIITIGFHLKNCCHQEITLWLGWRIFFFPFLSLNFCLRFAFQKWISCFFDSSGYYVMYYIFLDLTACNTAHFTKMKWVSNKIIILNVSRAPQMVTWFCLLYKPTMVYIAISPVISFSKRGKSKLYHVMLCLWRIAQSVALTAILRMVRIRCIAHEFPSLGDIGQKVVNTS